MSAPTDRGVFCNSANLPKLPVFSHCLIGFFFSIFIMAAASAGAQSYFFKSIDDPNATGPRIGVPPRTLAIGLNDSGVIVGSYSYGSNATGAFEYAAGSFSTISFPGVCGGSRCGSEVRGINNYGEAVGDYNDSSGNEHGYLLVNGSYTIFDFPEHNTRSRTASTIWALSSESTSTRIPSIMPSLSMGASAHSI